MASKKDNPPWLNYLEWNVLGEETPGGFVVMEVVVKIRPAGLLAIVKADNRSTGIVLFVGGRTLAGLSGEIRRKVKDENAKWRKDQFFKLD